MITIILFTASILLSLIVICILFSICKNLKKHKTAIERLLYPEIAYEKRYQDVLENIIHEIKMGKTPSLVGFQLTKEQFDELAPYVKDKSYLDNILRSRVPIS